MGEVVDHWHKYWKRYAASLALLVFISLVIASIAYPPLIPLAAGLITYKGVAVLGFLTTMTPAFVPATLGLLGAVATSIGFTVLRAATGITEFLVLSIKNCFRSKKEPDQFVSVEDSFEKYPQLAISYDGEKEMAALLTELDKRQKKHQELSQSLQVFVKKYQESGIKNEQLEANIQESYALVDKEFLELDLSTFEENYNDGIDINKAILVANQELTFKLVESQQLLASYQSSFPTCSTTKALNSLNIFQQPPSRTVTRKRLPHEGLSL